MENRNSSLDLLRAVSMFMVLTVHFLGWGGAVNVLSVSDVNYYAVMPIYFVSQIGNTLFFLLIGYFSNGNVRTRKLVFLQRKTTFYAFVISLGIFIFGLNPDINLRYAVKSLFPISFNRYWFISVYFTLYILSGPLCNGLKHCSKKMVLLVIGALLLHNTFLFPANMTLMQGVLAFVIGYALRNYKPFEKWRKGYVFLLYTLFLGAYAIVRVTARVSGIEHTLLDEGLRYVLILLMAVTFFVFFEKLEINFRWPTKISGNVLAVYLISACPSVVPLLYERLLSTEKIAKEYWFVPYYVVINVCIFGVCIAIDKAVTKLNNMETDLYIGLFRKLLNARRSSKGISL